MLLVCGDCGTWIVNATNGDLYGHVVAGDSRGRALMTSAREIFDNIARLTGFYPVLCPSPYSRPLLSTYPTPSPPFDSRRPSLDSRQLSPVPSSPEDFSMKIFLLKI